MLEFLLLLLAEQYSNAGVGPGVVERTVAMEILLKYRIKVVILSGLLSGYHGLLPGSWNYPGTTPELLRNDITT